MSLVRASLRLSRAAPRCWAPPSPPNKFNLRLHNFSTRNVSSTAGRRTTVAVTAEPAAIPASTAAAETVASASAKSGSGSGSSRGSSNMRYGLATAALVPLIVAAGGAYLLRPSEPSPELSNIATVPTSSLLRAYAVYTICSFPTIIDAAPSLLHAFTHSPIPGLKSLTEFVVRHTFFDQFVAGEDLPQCVAAMHDMYNRSIGGVLNYSAESELGDGLDPAKARAAESHNFEECKNAIEAIGEFERQIVASGGVPGSASFAIKISGLIDPSILERASTTICRLRALNGGVNSEAPFPGTPENIDLRIAAPDVDSVVAIPSVSGPVDSLGILATDAGVTDGDMVALKEFWGRLHALSARARDVGVKLMIDAEHAETQPVLDAMTLMLSREFNRPQPGVPFAGPTIFGTYQSYLRRAPYILDWAIRDSEANGYALGIKIVRGAYVVSDRKKWRAEGRVGPDPIWADKPATDHAYNSSVEKIVSTLAKQMDGSSPETALSVVFATHNPESVNLVLSQLEKYQLATRPMTPDGSIDTTGRLRLRDGLESKVNVAQLYGMRDDLTDRVVDMFEPGTPVALKYIAYGKLNEVLPFLARRAIENKSIMTGEGGAAVERKRVTDELWRRFTTNLW